MQNASGALAPDLVRPYSAEQALLDNSTYDYDYCVPKKLQVAVSKHKQVIIRAAIAFTKNNLAD